MNSMTGFGRATVEKLGHNITVEIKTVNHRFLDFNIRMPRAMLFLEDDIRNAIKSHLFRGRVDAFISYKAVGDSARKVSLDASLLAGYMEASAEISQRTGIANDLSMIDVMRLPDVLSFEDEPADEEELKEVLLEAVNAAVGDLKEARAAEGKRMAEDILSRGKKLEGITAKIKEREPVVVEEYKQKLAARLGEFAKETDLDANRFNAEILYFADRCAIAEETVRLDSHLIRLKEIISGEGASGRALDFLVQELNREYNTIGSKSSDVQITDYVLEAKGEVEKIREQVQNIE